MVFGITRLWVDCRKNIRQLVDKLFTAALVYSSAATFVAAADFAIANCLQSVPVKVFLKLVIISESSTFLWRMVLFYLTLFLD